VRRDDLVFALWFLVAMTVLYVLVYYAFHREWPRLR